MPTKLLPILAVVAGCATVPELPDDHPARADAPSAPQHPVASAVREDPLPLATDSEPSPHAGHRDHGAPPSPEPDSRVDAGADSHGGDHANP